MKDIISRKDMLLSIEQIKQRLPHTYPFLLIDRIVQQSLGECTSIKNVTFNEPFFMGHFPGKSIVPGVIIGEAIAQTSAFVGTVTTLEEKKEQKGFLSTMNLKFFEMVIPGDQLVIKAKVVKSLGGITKFMGEATVEGKKVVSADFNIAIM